MKKLSQTQIDALRHIGDQSAGTYCFRNTYGTLGPIGELRKSENGTSINRSRNIANRRTLDGLLNRYLVTVEWNTYRVLLTEQGQLVLDGQPEAAV